MTDAQLADNNLIESFRMHARWQQPVELLEDNGILMMAGANSRPGLYRNCAVRLDPTVSASETFDHARAFFGTRDRNFVLLTRKRLDADLDSLLQEAGIQPKGQSPCMIIKKPLDVDRLPAGIEVLSLETGQQLQDSVQVNMEAYPMLGLPAEEVRALFENPEKVLEKNVTGYVAYRDGVPLATALTYLSGDSAGIYWVGTTAAAQRQGLAGLCTRLAVNAGFERGAKLVTLQASPFGLPLYQRLGFQGYDSTGFYVCRS